jgi:hypothetical protein
MCYGILYGMGAHSLSEQLEVTPEEAAVFLDKFKQTYKGYSTLVFVAEQESVVLFVHANTYDRSSPSQGECVPLQNGGELPQEGVR